MKAKLNQGGRPCIKDGELCVTLTISISRTLRDRVKFVAGRSGVSGWVERAMEERLSKLGCVDKA